MLLLYCTTCMIEYVVSVMRVPCVYFARLPPTGIFLHKAPRTDDRRLVSGHLQLQGARQATQVS